MLPPSSTILRPFTVGVHIRPAGLGSPKASRHRPSCQFVVFCPAIEMPVQNATPPSPHLRTKIGTIIARPAAIRLHCDKLHRGQIGMRTSSEPAVLSLAPSSSSTRMQTCFDSRQVPHDLPIDPGNRRKFARPVGAFVRPRNPCRLMRLPLRRHAVRQGARCSLRHARHQSQPSLGDRRIRIDAPVAEERPVAPHFIHPLADRTRPPAPLRSQPKPGQSPGRTGPR